MADEQYWVLETSYRLKYTTKKPVPIPEVIESLRHIEKILERTPAFVEKAFAELEVVSMSVYVDSLQTGSLTEDFLIRFVFKGRENYDQAKEVYDKLLEDNTVIRTVVAVGVGALIGYGVFNALSPGQSTTQIEAYNNTIVNVGGEVGLQSEDISAILKATRDKKALSKQAIGVVRPAKADPDATIEMDEIPELTVGKEFISSAPEEYEAPMPSEKTETYRDVDIIIYASDRDKATTNWAGTIPGIVDHRVRFSLSEAIDPRELHGRIKVKGDVVVVFRYVPSKKEYQAKIVEIESVDI